jgi:hypothetical protein
VGFHYDTIYADPRGADAIATINMMLGSVVARPVGWELGIEAVRRHMKLQSDGQPKLFIDPSCEMLIRQLEQLRFAETRENHNSREKQHDYNDHGPDALRYFFSEHYVNRPSGRLSDIYSGRLNSEAATFFQNHTKIRNSDRVAF